MSEPSDDPNAPQPQPSPPAVHPPSPRLVPPNRLRLSLVWLVPIAALVIGLSLLVRTVLATGPQIAIEFNTAEGLEAGKTEVRYKEVVIGRVQSVSLREDRRKVIVTVQLDRQAASVARADTQFWVVRPRIGTGGVSGLGTLLSGAYIGVDAGTSDEARDRFDGLEAPPFILRGEPGASFVLVADDLGSLDVGSPISYRRTRVGRVVGYALDPKRDELTVKVFVEAPYHTLVTPQTRFWNTSGVDLTLNANGLTLDTQTLASVLAGGISFERMGTPAGTVAGPALQASADGSRFMLFNDRKAALAPPDGEPVPVRMVFDQSVRGLVVGAPVDFLGVDIGVVKRITLLRDARRGRFPVEVSAELYPLRLGSLRDDLLAAAPSGPGQPGVASRPAGVDDDRLAIQRLIAKGLKAQTRTGNLLTGQLFVALDFFDSAGVPPGSEGAVAAAASAPSAKADAKLSRAERRARRDARRLAAAQAAAQAADAQGVLTLPTMPGTLSELQPQLAQIVQKLSQVPFDAIGRDLQATLVQARAALKDAGTAINQLTPEAQATLRGVQGSLTRAQVAIDRLDRNLLDENAPVQRQTEQTLAEVQRAAASLRALADALQRHPESLLRGQPADPPLSRKP